ncbi:MAG: 50S ribosomal protein L1 [Patescibacteria group bacterium]
MKKRSKRYLTALAKVEKNKAYSVSEAIEIIQSNPTKFDPAVEVHMNLGIDPKKSDQLIRAVVSLPHGTGKTKRVIAFVSPDQEAEAKEAGADLIGNDEMIQKIKTTGKIEFDVAVATPMMMKKIGPIAKTLGQKGLMPNPKAETVGPDVKKMITAVKLGKIAYKNDESANVHAMVGKVSFEKEKLVVNIQTFIDSVRKSKPAASKGTYIKNAVICTTMGPSVKLNLV